MMGEMPNEMREMLKEIEEGKGTKAAQQGLGSRLSRRRRSSSAATPNPDDATEASMMILAEKETVIRTLRTQLQQMEMQLDATRRHALALQTDLQQVRAVQQVATARAIAIEAAARQPAVASGSALPVPPPASAPGNPMQVSRAYSDSEDSATAVDGMLVNLFNSTLEPPALAVSHPSGMSMPSTPFDGGFGCSPTVGSTGAASAFELAFGARVPAVSSSFSTALPTAAPGGPLSSVGTLPAESNHGESVDVPRLSRFGKDWV